MLAPGAHLNCVSNPHDERRCSKSTVIAEDFRCAGFATRSGVGANTQTLAAAPDVARAAMYSRSSAGTNNPVRAPGARSRRTAPRAHSQLVLVVLQRDAYQLAARSHA